MKTEETTIDKISSRPRFKIFTDLSPESYAENLKIFLKNHQNDFTGNINREVATISVKTENDKYWKPYLSLRTETEEEKTTIRGIFGPSSAVWTFFMFLYFLFGILWMVFITLWFVGKQIKIDDYNWALPVSFLMIVLFLLTYLAARFGQKKAKKEMQKLRQFAIDSTLQYEKKDF